MGGMASGSSSEPMVMSSSSGASSAAYVRGVPQRGQKLRAALADERKVLGSPLTMRNLAFDTVSQATEGAALIRRHIEQ